jgi:hypothetical protein
MLKRRFFNWFYLRYMLQSLAWVAGLVLAAWLLYRFVPSLHRFYFSDILFITGGILLVIGGFWVMNRPDSEAQGYYGWIPMQRGNPGEDQGMDSREDYYRQMALRVRLLVIGLLTVLAAALTRGVPK